MKPNDRISVLEVGLCSLSNNLNLLKNVFQKLEQNLVSLVGVLELLAQRIEEQEVRSAIHLDLLNRLAAMEPE